MKNQKNQKLSKKWTKPIAPNGVYRNNWSTFLRTPHKKFTIYWSENTKKYNGKYMLSGKEEGFETIEDAKDYVLLKLHEKPSEEVIEYLYMYAESL